MTDAQRKVPRLERVYLLLGTNQGNRERNLSTAVSLLVTEMAPYLFSGIAESSVLETEPWGFECEDRFLNQAIAFDTSLTALQILDLCQWVEEKMGRDRSLPQYDGQGKRIYRSRIIDIDILLYGERRIATPRLTVPHPRLAEREFALTPLRELAPADLLERMLGKDLLTAVG